MEAVDKISVGVSKEKAGQNTHSLEKRNKRKNVATTC